MTNNTNNTTPKLRLKPGLHAIVAVSLRAGNGRTSAILSTACVCNKLGLPAVVLNLDLNSNMLEENLPQNTIITPADYNSASMLESITQAENHARETGSLLLIDLPSAWETNCWKKSDLRQSGILDRCDSLMAIVALVPNTDGIVCATEGLAAFQPNNKVLIRVMSHGVGENLPSDQWGELSKYPIWDSKKWRQTTKTILSHSGPPPAECRSRLADDNLNEIERLDFEDVIEAIETSALRPIYEHLLAPITEALNNPE